jgi:hypothetical protein
VRRNSILEERHGEKNEERRGKTWLAGGVIKVAAALLDLQVARHGVIEQIFLTGLRVRKIFSGTGTG